MPRTVWQQRGAACKGRSLGVRYREKRFPEAALTGAGALQLRPRREGGFHRGRRGRASGAKLARFGRATTRSSCQGPEVRCVGHQWRFICCAAGALGPGSCRGSSGLDSPRRPWTEVMGDSKEAGAEAPPAGAAARGGLSLLSQGESEEPAQVSRPRGGTCRAPELRAGSTGEGCHGSRRLPEPSARLPGNPPKRADANVPVVGYSGIYLQDREGRHSLCSERAYM